jgi:hypothetical protein
MPSNNYQQSSATRVEATLARVCEGEPVFQPVVLLQPALVAEHTWTIMQNALAIEQFLVVCREMKRRAVNKDRVLFRAMSVDKWP